MKRIALLFALSAALSAQQYGVWITQGTVGYMLIKIGNTAVPGVPLGPDPSFQGGYLISVRTADPRTTGFVVTVRFQDGDSILSRSLSIVHERSAACDTVFFEIGDRPVRSILIEETSPHSSQEFPIS